MSLRTEASELRFDKEALESKLRKFAAHCQRLEDDKAGAIDALRSCDIDVEQEGDINDAIISLCDKLASKSGREFNAEIDRLQQDNKTLQARIERLTKADEVVAKKADGYQREIKDLKRTMTDKNDDVSGARSEMSRKLRFLEQENLQLMLDVKSTKKQLQTAREELEMLRMNVADSTTMDFNSVGLGGSGSVQKVCSTETSNNENKRPRTSADATPGRKRARASKAALVERTNQRDKESGTPGTKKQWVALDKNRTNVAAPGLGEAAIDGDNTGECKQS